MTMPGTFRTTVAASEPPKPYEIALKKLRAASALPAATPRRCTCEDGVPRPYSAAIERLRAEGR